MDLGKQRKRKAATTADLLDAKLNDDLLAEVILRAVSSSPSPFSDLVSLRIICKRFRSASENNWVFRHMSAFDTKIKWKFPSGYQAFLDRCMAVGNPHANYVKGMVDYFSLRKIDSGMRHLTTAADGGVADASYALGMIAYSNEQTRPQAVAYLNRLADRCAKRRRGRLGMLPALREKTKNLLWTMWPNLVLVPIQGPKCGHPVCVSYKPNNWCCTTEEQHKFCSEDCMWRHEYNKFCSCLGNVAM